MSHALVPLSSGCHIRPFLLHVSALSTPLCKCKCNTVSTTKLGARAAGGVQPGAGARRRWLVRAPQAGGRCWAPQQQAGASTTTAAAGFLATTAPAGPRSSSRWGWRKRLPPLLSPLGGGQGACCPRPATSQRSPCRWCNRASGQRSCRCGPRSRRQPPTAACCTRDWRGCWRETRLHGLSQFIGCSRRRRHAGGAWPWGEPPKPLAPNSRPALHPGAVPSALRHLWRLVWASQNRNLHLASPRALPPTSAHARRLHSR